MAFVPYENIPTNCSISTDNLGPCVGGSSFDAEDYIRNRTGWLDHKHADNSEAIAGADS